MIKILLVVAIAASPAIAGKSSKPASAHTQQHADRATKDAAKARRDGNPSLAASREKLAAQRQKQADLQKKREAPKGRR
jgi:hypothetical protein